MSTYVKQSEKKQKPSEQTNYNNDVIPLELIVREKFGKIYTDPKFPTTSNGTLYGDDKINNDGQIIGFTSSLDVCIKLWRMNNARWLAIRNRVHIGYIKGTKKHGNTSVSMGLAVRYFEKNTNKSCVIFLNCGTGGIKYQCYAQKANIIYLLFEFKPENRTGPNSLKVCTYTPKNEITFEVNVEALKTEMADAINSHKELLGSDIQQVDVLAFITGDIRKKFEDSTQENKQIFENILKDYFHGIAKEFNGMSYFMSQDEEGTLELVGADTMYKNLTNANLLELDGASVVGSFGIGRGSCQFMTKYYDAAKCTDVFQLIGYTYGMGSLQKLSQVGVFIDETLNNSPEKMDAFLTALESVKTPIIAFKSGATLLLENKEYPSVKANMFDTPLNKEVVPTPPESMKVTAAMTSTTTTQSTNDYALSQSKTDASIQTQSDAPMSMIDDASTSTISVTTISTSPQTTTYESKDNITCSVETDKVLEIDPDAVFKAVSGSDKIDVEVNDDVVNIYSSLNNN